MLVTHDLDLARRCDRVLVVDDARVRFDGDPDAAVADYVAAVAGVSQPGLLGLYRPGDHRAAPAAGRGEAGRAGGVQPGHGAVRSMPASAGLPGRRAGARPPRPGLDADAGAGRPRRPGRRRGVAALQWWLRGYAKAVETLVDLLALALAAAVLTATTPVNAMLDAIVRWVAPLRRVGVDPERVALTFTLAIQALPGTLTLALETRDAARARGLRRRALPLALRGPGHRAGPRDRGRADGPRDRRRLSSPDRVSSRAAPQRLVEEPPVPERVPQHRDPADRRVCPRDPGRPTAPAARAVLASAVDVGDASGAASPGCPRPGPAPGSGSPDGVGHHHRAPSMASST